MVFSFFKKPPPEKMVARPAAAPVRPQSETPSVPPPPAGSAPVVEEAGEAPRDLAPLDFTDSNAFSGFSESPGEIQIENDIDPIEADIEQAAILYANAQDAATRALLENAVHVHHYGPGERLWLMLFDFYKLTNQHAPFDALAIEYAKAFEKSPPPFRSAHAAKPTAKAPAAAPAGAVMFKGELTGDNDAAFAALDQAVDKSPKLRLDLSKVKEIDDLGAERMLGVLEKVLKKKGEVELIGREALIKLLESRIETGRREDAGCWLLLLDFYQQMGQQDVFEDMAVNYAVTFEMSPPSWDSKRVSMAKPKPAPAAKVAAAEADEETVSHFELKGELKAERFGGLPAFTEAHDPVVVDFSAVSRIDFVSAGTLVNLLTPAKRSGKRVVILHPNHLVAELLGVVGLRGVADITYAKA